MKACRRSKLVLVAVLPLHAQRKGLLVYCILYAMVVISPSDMINAE
jgi:hypothetical protein